MSAPRQTTTTPLFVLAIVFTAIGAALGLIIAPILSFLLPLPFAGKIVFAVGAVFGFAGFTCWFVRNRILETRTIANFLHSQRRSKVSRLANELHLTVFKTEMLISRCISKGLVEGFFDRVSGEFFTKEAFLNQVAIDSCPNCSAPVAQIRLVGEQCRCDSCGKTIEYSWESEPAPSDGSPAA